MYESICSKLNPENPWLAAEGLVRKVERHGEDPFRSAILWHLLCSVVKHGENNRLVRGRPPALDDVQQHERALEKIVQTGSVLVRKLDQREVSLPGHYSRENLRAMLTRARFDLRLRRRKLMPLVKP